MSFIRNMLGDPARLANGWRSEGELLNDPAAWTSFGGDMVDGHTAAGVTVNQQTAMNCAAAMACTRALAETLSTLPAVVYENMEENERRRARTSRMWSLLHDAPNRHMDSRTFYGMQTKRLVNRGNAFALQERNNRDEVIALWPVHNSRVRPFARAAKLLPNGRYLPAEVEYRVFMDDDNPLRYEPIAPRDMLNVVGFDTEDGIVASGVVPRAKQEIALDLAAQEFSASIYHTGAMPLGMVSHPGYIADDEKRKAFRADINRVHSGRENWHQVGVLWEGSTWQKLGYSPADVQMIEGRMMSAKTICMFYNTPPAIIQIFDDYKFSTVEAMLKQFVMLSIRPLAVCWERAVGTQILSDESEDLLLEFVLEGLLRGDPESQAKTNALLRSWGALSADEWRAQNNWNPLPKGQGKAYIVPLNHAPLEDVLSGKARRNAKQLRGEESDGETTQLPEFDAAFLAALISVARDSTAMAKAMRDGEAAEKIRVTSRVQSDGGILPPIAAAVDPDAESGDAAGQRNARRQDATATLQDFALRVLGEGYSRLVRLEAERAASAAAKGGSAVGQWMDAFYAKFEINLAEAIETGLAGVFEARGWPAELVEAKARDIARAHCEASRQLLLAATECQPDELLVSISECVKDWAAERKDEMLRRLAA